MNKYGARKTVVDGIRFDSQKEALRWCELKLMEKAGEITDLDRQIKLEIVPKTSKYNARYYIADFRYREKNGGWVFEDVKGVRTQVYSLKKALVFYRYGIDIREV